MPDDRIKLQIPKNRNKAVEFLQYLRAEFNKSKGWSSEGQRNQDGTFIERGQITFNRDSAERVLTYWEFEWDAKGYLSSITVEAPPESLTWWKDVVNSVYQNALAAAVSADKEEFFRRDQFAYMGPNLDGEYWIARWRIAPAIPDDEGEWFTERIVFFDHRVEAVDRNQSIAMGQVEADRMMVLLSLFINIGLYRIPVENKWVYTGPAESKRYQLGYHSDTPYPKTMPKKGGECRLGKSVQVDRRDFRATLPPGRNLRLPSDVRALFRAYRKLSPADQEVYFGAAALYHIGLTTGGNLRSVRLSYQIAAVEALAEPDKQPRQGFVEMVSKYNPKIPIEFTKGIYGSIRSAHFHHGHFSFGEYEPMLVGPIFDPRILSRTDLQISADQILQPTLIDWLLDRSQQGPSSFKYPDALLNLPGLGA